MMPPVPSESPDAPSRVAWLRGPGGACRTSLAGFALLLAACQTYNDQVAIAVRAFEDGQFDRAEAAFEKVDSTFLRAVETGMVAFTAGQFDRALERFEVALSASDDARELSPVDPLALSESFLTLAINESQSTYVGEGYERVMLHVMLGLTYLTQGSAEDVVVEARLVDEILTGEEELYETNYGAGGIGHLLSAVAYELIGQPDAAYIDYKRMHEKGVGGELTSAALLRLSAELGRQDDHSRWASDFGERELPPQDSASIVVIGGAGLGPSKREQRIDVLVSGRFIPWAVPQFDRDSDRAPGFELVFPESGVSVATSTVENVAAVARENLDDRIALLAARSAFRGIVKSEIAHNLMTNDRTWVAAVGGVFAVMTVLGERADLRAWRTLPHTWEAARAFVPAGEFIDLELRENGVGGQTVQLGRYSLVPGETMFVLARSLPSGVVAHVIGGELSSTPSIPLGQ